MNKKYDQDYAFLNSLELNECEGVKLGDVLHTQIELHSRLCFCKRIIVMFHQIINAINSLRIQFIYESKGKSDTLFLFLHDREDHKNNLQKAYKIVNDAVWICKSRKHKLELRRLREIHLIRKWNKEIKFGVKSILSRWTYVVTIFETYMKYSIVENIINQNGYPVKALVGCHSIIACDNFFVQKYMSGGKKVIGIFGALPSNMPEFLTKSENKVIFVPGKYSIDHINEMEDMNKMETDKKILISVGVLSSIEKKIQMPSCYQNYKIVLFTNSEELHNKKIFLQEMKIIQEYCKSKKSKFTIKLHPSSYNNRAYRFYFDNADKRYVEHIYRNEISASQLIQASDIVVVNSSTVIMEALSMWKPVFLYLGTNEVNDYNVSNMFTFSDIEEFRALMDEVNTEAFKIRMESIRNYFIQSGKVEDNLKEAFLQFDIT